MVIVEQGRDAGEKTVTDLSDETENIERTGSAALERMANKTDVGSRIDGDGTVTAQPSNIGEGT